ncbi:MAG: PsbP-related protein [Bacteroidota bacterium]|nr:PsbP-related protein [Bacteroidota bacterium]
MKTRRLFAVILPVFLLFACTDDTPKQENNNEEVTVDVEDTKSNITDVFSSKEFGFSVEFPENPVPGSQDVPTEIGNLKLNTFMHDAGSQVYFVAISNMPKLMTGLSDKGDMLDGGVSGMLEQFSKVEILKKEEIKIDGHPGRLVEATGITSGIEVYNRANIYLVGNKFYQVYVLAEKAKADKEAIEAFISSFTLIEK